MITDIGILILVMLFSFSATAQLSLDGVEDGNENDNTSTKPLEVVISSPLPDTLYTDTELTVVDFKKGDWQQFRDNARLSGKPYFVDFYADWCGPCKLLDEIVFSDEQVANYANENFMAYKADYDWFSGMDIAEQYDVKHLPTILFFGPNGQLLARHQGVFSPEGFLMLLQQYTN